MPSFNKSNTDAIQATPSTATEPQALASPTLSARQQRLLVQLRSHQTHERHANDRETTYWCRQWRLLAEEFAKLMPDSF
mgnify:CR=1 FL=1